MLQYNSPFAAAEIAQPQQVSLGVNGVSPLDIGMKVEG
jgi:hypothetical protein